MLIQRIRFLTINGRTAVLHDEYPDFTPPRSSLHAGMRTERPKRWRGKSAQEVGALPIDTDDVHCSLAALDAL